MASARCIHCNATLQPNSAYCLECGQLIPQTGGSVAPTPAPRARQEVPVAASPPVASAADVPLPRSLPWQQAPATAAAASEPVAAAAPLESIELVFSDGERLRVSGQVVLGRQPADTAHAMGARSIPIADTTRSVSRVHLFLTVADGAITVADAGSANGSRLQRGRSLVQLPTGGVATAAAPGDTVWLGDVSIALRA